MKPEILGRTQFDRKIAVQAEDISLLRPRMRKRMGEEMASIFEEVGRAALEKAMARSVAAIADEVVAFSDDLAKKVRDTLGKKGIVEAVNYIPAWAESIGEKALDYASGEVSSAILEGMKAHFPIGGDQQGQDQGQQPIQAVVQYRGALYLEVEALSNEPFQRALDRINDLKEKGKDPIKGTMARLNKTEDPGKIQGIFYAAKKLGKKWKDVAKAAAKKYRDITGKIIS